MQAVSKFVNSVLKMSNLDEETVLDIVRLFFLLKEKEHQLSLFSVISCLSKLSEKKDIREILVRDTPFMSSILEIALDPNSSVRIWRKTSFLLAVLLKPDALVWKFLQDELNLGPLTQLWDTLLRMCLGNGKHSVVAQLPAGIPRCLHTQLPTFQVFEIHRDEILGVPCILANYRKCLEGLLSLQMR